MIVSVLAGETYYAGRSPGNNEFHEFATLSVSSGEISHTILPFRLPTINPDRRSIGIVDSIYGITMFEKMSRCNLLKLCERNP
jgi:hypothetical protein